MQFPSVPSWVINAATAHTMSVAPYEVLFACDGIAVYIDAQDHLVLTISDQNPSLLLDSEYSEKAHRIVNPLVVCHEQWPARHAKKHIVAEHIVLLVEIAEKLVLLTAAGWKIHRPKRLRHPQGYACLSIKHPDQDSHVALTIDDAITSKACKKQLTQWLHQLQTIGTPANGSLSAQPRWGHLVKQVSVPHLILQLQPELSGQQLQFVLADIESQQQLQPNRDLVDIAKAALQKQLAPAV